MKHYLTCEAPICADSIEPDFKREKLDRHFHPDTIGI